MKKLFTTGMLLITMISTSQIKFVSNEYGKVNIAIDPTASIKEKGLDIMAEVELISYWKYVKFGVQSFGVLEGGYLDATGTFGVNLTSGYFETWRAYGGLRLGLINRGKYVYPLAGIEGGIDFKINKNIIIGIRGTIDHREDFLYTDGIPGKRCSSDIRIGFEF